MRYAQPHNALRFLAAGLIAVASAMPAFAQADGSGATFNDAAAGIQEKLEASLAELAQLREAMAEEQIPLSQKLSALEQELVAVRKEYQSVSRTLDNRTLDLGNLQREIKSRENEANYLSNLLGEYIRNFESGLHIAELQRYEQTLEEARLAMDNDSLSTSDLYAAQISMIDASVERLFDALNGSTYNGTAVGPDGKVETGTFVLVGPVALFRSLDGGRVGTVEQRLGSLEPAIIEFSDPLDTEVAAAMLAGEGSGSLMLDPTLGNAHILETTEDTFLEHVQKGGPVMYPIFGMAAIALLVALYKWLEMMSVRNPSQSRLRALLEAIASKDATKAKSAAKQIQGPSGKMLEAGVEHLGEPRELIEEVMYEKVLATRLRINAMLPFIAICAAAAPLLGLLGTVTGIINTFKLITVFGTGDVKTLSGGISEALITTKFGLIVAIPALLLHVFLSRKAKGVIDQMEKADVAFINQVIKNPLPATAAATKTAATPSDAKPDSEPAKVAPEKKED